jgi:hypothetical protein
MKRKTNNNNPHLLLPKEEKIQKTLKKKPKNRK